MTLIDEKRPLQAEPGAHANTLQAMIEHNNTREGLRRDF